MVQDTLADKKMEENWNWNSELKCTNNGAWAGANEKPYLWLPLWLCPNSKILAEIGSTSGQHLSGGGAEGGLFKWSPS